jgi:hypothetical protein
MQSKPMLSTSRNYRLGVHNTAAWGLLTHLPSIADKTEMSPQNSVEMNLQAIRVIGPWPELVGPSVPAHRA